MTTIYPTHLVHTHLHRYAPPTHLLILLWLYMYQYIYSHPRTEECHGRESQLHTTMCGHILWCTFLRILEQILIFNRANCQLVDRCHIMNSHQKTTRATDKISNVMTKLLLISTYQATLRCFLRHYVNMRDCPVLSTE